MNFGDLSGRFNDLEQQVERLKHCVSLLEQAKQESSVIKIDYDTMDDCDKNTCKFLGEWMGESIYLCGENAIPPGNKAYSECVDELNQLRARVIELHTERDAHFESLMEFINKTEWIQNVFDDGGVPFGAGLHRADAIRAYVKHLEEQNKALLHVQKQIEQALGSEP